MYINHVVHPMVDSPVSNFLRKLSILSGILRRTQSITVLVPQKEICKYTDKLTQTCKKIMAVSYFGERYMIL